MHKDKKILDAHIKYGESRRQDIVISAFYLFETMRKIEFFIAWIGKTSIFVDLFPMDKRKQNTVSSINYKRLRFIGTSWKKAKKMLKNSQKHHILWYNIGV